MVSIDHFLQHHVDEMVASLRNISLAFVYDELSSTQNQAHAILEMHQHSAMVVLAKKQTQGRGRMSRSWLMAEGDIALSLILRPPCLPGSQNLVPLMLGISCVQALAKLGVEAYLKWPNDIIIAGDEANPVQGYLGHFRKVGGILIENVYQNSRFTASIIGIGLNIMPNPACLTAVPHAGYLRQVLPDLDWLSCFRMLVTQIDASLDTVHQAQFDERIIESYGALCKTLGRSVTVERQPPVAGIARAINAQGALVVNDGIHDHLITAGDVVLL